MRAGPTGLRYCRDWSRWLSRRKRAPRHDCSVAAVHRTDLSGSLHFQARTGVPRGSAIPHSRNRMHQQRTKLQRTVLWPVRPRSFVPPYSITSSAHVWSSGHSGGWAEHYNTGWATAECEACHGADFRRASLCQEALRSAAARATGTAAKAILLIVTIGPARTARRPTERASDGQREIRTHE